MFTTDAMSLNPPVKIKYAVFFINSNSDLCSTFLNVVLYYIIWAHMCIIVNIKKINGIL